MSVSLKFHDVVDSLYIELSAVSNHLQIKIVSYEEYAFIELDKATAIKLSKELRKQIALLDWLWLRKLNVKHSISWEVILMC